MIHLYPQGNATWRRLGSLDFRSMTASTLTATTTVDGVTFTEETAGVFDGLSSSNAIEIGGTGLRESGAGTGLRAVRIPMADFCSAVPDVDYCLGLMVEYTGAPTGAGEVVAAVCHDINNFGGISVDATLVTSVLRDAGSYPLNRTVAHGGALRRAGAVFLPGHMAHVTRITSVAADRQTHPEEITDDLTGFTQASLQADAGEPARDSASQLLIYLNNDSISIERVHIYTTAPGAPTPSTCPDPALTTQVPAFADGTTGGAGGTVSDGGQAGRVTFTLPSSGHTDGGDGCWIAWPVRDALARLLPDLPTFSLGTESRYGAMPIGWAEVTEVTAPTAGNGVRVGAMVCAAPSAALVTASDAQGYAAELDWTATPGVRAAAIRSSGWVVTTAETHADIDRARVAGDLLNNAVANGHRSGDDRARGSRYAGNETPITGLNSADPLWLVAYAYRTGASAGSESVTVDVRALVATVEAP